MKVLEYECEVCKSHVDIDEENKICRCEECDWTFKLQNKSQFLRVLRDATEYGPKEKRVQLTPAGQELAQAYEANEPPDSDETWNTILARRGVIEDEGTLKNLREGGFIF